MRLGRVFNTVRYLRPVQVANRLQRRIAPLRTIPVVEDLDLLPRPHVRPARENRWGFDGQSFRFLNARYPCSGDSRWSPPAAPRLWTYNLHYFEYLWGISPEDALRLVEDWVDANRSASSPGWEPYPLSLRIREWIEWLHANPDIPADRRQSLVRSVASQSEALYRQLELHLLGNHIAENAITLCWAGISFAGRRAHRWLREGLRLMRGELLDQILLDEVHDERSPMYQALLAHALLRLEEVAKASARLESTEVAVMSGTTGARLLRGLRQFVHPDGDYALVNDSVLGIAPSLAELEARFPSADCGVEAERGGSTRSGYCAWRDGDSYLLFDGGPIGPDHQPGHGHADNLSFELSAAGRRLITDTGVFSYAEGPHRDYDRSTKAHNTVEIDGQNQAEVWAAFRCGRRPVSRAVRLAEAGAKPLDLRGEYTAQHGRVSVEHERSISVSPGLLKIVDGLRSPGEHTATTRLHFAAGIELEGAGGEWHAVSAGRRVASVRSASLAWACSASPYHPEFGVEIERQCLTAKLPFVDSATAQISVSFA